MHNRAGFSRNYRMAWYVMRDLTRANSKHPAWEALADSGYRVYTPLTWKVKSAGGRKVRFRRPVVHDLLFVESTRECLDPFVEKLPTLQYRFVRGGAYGEVMTVGEEEMNRFILATSTDSEPLYYQADEITPRMVGRKVKIVGGALDGFEGRLLSIRGMRKRRLIVEIPGMLSAAVEVNPDLIQFAD